MELHKIKFADAFLNPKKEYGEVPFYWWTGDRLDKQRLTEQLEKLSDSSVAGVQINYAHMNGGGEKNEPHGGFGKSIPGTPLQFSEEWWDFFTHAAKECERLGMGVGVGDYTIAWIGNGFFTDKIVAAPGMCAENLTCEKQRLFSGDENSFNDSVLAVITYSDSGAREPVIIYERGRGVISPVSGCCEAYIIGTQKTPLSINPMNPGCGKMLVDIYFREFERRLPQLKSGTLNYFFQDELIFGCDIRTLWHENLRKEIQNKYSYDILGFLPHLFFNLGNITAKIRLDIADVRTQLIEDSYFKPIYAFHAERGMIYGCDQAGRGKEPDEFSDYFRTVRWFTAPGNDTPGRAADLIKVKVNSSIAHLYRRPRVWLEGYHSSGWGTTLESITAPTSDNFIFGANLLNLHGLYYSTKGGFFEWAPPDFHFRMPYWDDEKYWLMKYRRLAALLTTGAHRCDAAIYYPVSSCDYGENAKECVEKSFKTAETFFSHGLDFDFIDFQSIENSICSDGRLKAADERYKALIFCNVDCIRYSVIKKIKEFLDCGGVVAFGGVTPYASSLAGANDEVLNGDILDILSHPNCALCAGPNELFSFINSKITRSFIPEELYSDDKVYVNQRVCGNDKLFFVRYAPKDSVCRFEAQGAPYLLDTYTGKIHKLTGTISQAGFTFIKMPNAADADTVILFTDEYPDIDGIINTSGFDTSQLIKTVELDGEWDFSLQPTLDNRYGDFYIPAGGVIGAEARFFDCACVEHEGDIPQSFEYRELPYCTDTDIIKICTEDKNIGALTRFAAENDIKKGSFIFQSKEYSAEEQRLHSRYGYVCSEDDFETTLYEQGYHGLKGRVYDDNMIFSGDSVFISWAYAEKAAPAYLYLCGVTPDFLFVNGAEITDFSKALELHAGCNKITAGFVYDAAKAPDYRNRAKIKRAGIYLLKSEKEPDRLYELSRSSFANEQFFTPTAPGAMGVYCFKFTAPPAFISLEANVFGKLLSAYCDGEKMAITNGQAANFGGTKYSAVCAEKKTHISEVLLYVKSENARGFTSLLPEPVKLSCEGAGKLTTGDTAGFGVLKNYSGKFIYERTVKLEKIFTDERFILKIANAGATVRLEVNGVCAAVFTYKPFEADISDLVVNGENTIKITVSNTLCNHYSTIPSKYSNFPRDAASGLIGPVFIEVVKD